MLEVTSVEIFHADFPIHLLKQITGGLLDAYRAAHACTLAAYNRDQTRDNTAPWIRRGKVEEMLHETATSFGAPVSVNTVKVGFWNHEEIKVGRVLLTQSRTAEDDSVIRPANWKNVLARKSERLLFPEFSREPLAPGEDCILYATLLHGRSKPNPKLLEFAAVRFPKTNVNGDITGYHDGCIDLMDMFHQLFVSPEPLSQDVEDTAFPTLRQDLDYRMDAS